MKDSAATLGVAPSLTVTLPAGPAKIASAPGVHAVAPVPSRSDQFVPLALQVPPPVVGPAQNRPAATFRSTCLSVVVSTDTKLSAGAFPTVRPVSESFPV
ncbi:hypothetical protein KHHGKMAE_3850 [Methylobacterium persicinum]|nr:hypothetical protein KHHGKMAE_3850 [Methylobacterium persicinum]